MPPAQLDVWGLGPRVPLLIVSPFVKAGYIEHQQLEFSSVVKFVEEVFGLPFLTIEMRPQTTCSMHSTSSMRRCRRCRFLSASADERGLSSGAVINRAHQVHDAPEGREFLREVAGCGRHA